MKLSILGLEIHPELSWFWPAAGPCTVSDSARYLRSGCTPQRGMLVISVRIVMDSVRHRPFKGIFELSKSGKVYEGFGPSPAIRLFSQTLWGMTVDEFLKGRCGRTSLCGSDRIFANTANVCVWLSASRPRASPFMVRVDILFMD